MVISLFKLISQRVYCEFVDKWYSLKVDLLKKSVYLSMMLPPPHVINATRQYLEGRRNSYKKLIILSRSKTSRQ